MTYTLSRPSFNMFAEVLGKERAEAFVSEFEHTVNTQRIALEQQLTHQFEQQLALNQAQLKIALKEELRNELVTRELFEERFKLVDKRFEQIDKRLDYMSNRMDSLMVWGFATIATFSGLTVAAIKLL
jgi:hypothetical protein